MILGLNRPKGYKDKSEKYLSKAGDKLAGVIRKVQKEHHFETLKLSNKAANELAAILIEFAEDLHNDIGIWKSVESYNFRFFGTKLPFMPAPDSDPDDYDKPTKKINKYQVQYFLWGIFPEFKRDLIFSPRHSELEILAENVADFIEYRFATIPTDSAIKKFLSQTNEFGWDVKRKLIWLGQHSYLFRQHFKNYAEHNERTMTITVIDHYVCKRISCWSGLGVIDVLAQLLDISEEQATELRSWYELHMAFYKVLSIEGPIVKMLNLINDKPYTARAGEPNPFIEQEVILGSVAPWKGEWYWSGQQKRIPKASEEQIQTLKDEFLKDAHELVYRYNEQYLERAKESLKEHYNDFMEYHQKELVVYPDGQSMTDDFDKQVKISNEKKLNKIGESDKKPDLSKTGIREAFPEEFFDGKDGVAVYYNPNEGQEIMQGFNHILSGFRKKGENLNTKELDVIRAFILSDAISPQFVKKLINEYGEKSILSAFSILDFDNNYALEFILRRYKGHFYRKRYPSITLVNTE